MKNSAVFLMNKAKDDIFGYGVSEKELINSTSPYMNLSDYVVVPVEEVIDPSLPLLERANRLVELGKISVSDGVSYNSVSDTYSVPIEWGDWKHDHARLDLLFRDVLGLYRIAEDITEVDGSDSYSSIHTFSTY